LRFLNGRRGTVLLRLPLNRSAATPATPATPAKADETGAAEVASLLRQAAAEAIGTGFRVAAVIGSGIAAARLSPGNLGLQLLENSVATGAALAALVVALQPVSAAFNPLVTVLERIFGALTTAETLTLITAQVAGGAVGAVVANLMFGLPALTLAGTTRTGAGLWLGEVVATVGLLLVIFGATRAGRGGQVGYLVGAYITAAYWFTSSTSFANPAVTLARTLSDTFAGIAPGSAPMFLLMQLLGGGLAYALIRVLYPAPPMIAATIADTAVDAAPPSPRSEVHR